MNGECTLIQIYDNCDFRSIYGRLAHKHDPLQVSAGRPAPTIGSSKLCITSDNDIHMLYLSPVSYASSVLFFLQYPNYDFANFVCRFPTNECTHL